MNNFGQFIGVNIITILLFLLSVAVYVLFGFMPFALMLIVAAFYAICANIWVLGAGRRSEIDREQRWEEYFPESYAMVQRARASLMMRSEAMKEIRDAAVRRAYQEASAKVEENYQRSLEFLETYDYLNNPGDPSGRLTALAIGARDSVDDFNDFLDDARDSDGGAGDELDAQIRGLRRFLADIPPEDIDHGGLSRVIERLEKISDFLHERPESAGGFRRLISYYLPTLQKLLTKRRDMERAGVGGEKARAARNEISAALSSMPEVLDDMLASAYEGEAVDIIAEKGVMDDFIKQESFGGVH